MKRESISTKLFWALNDLRRILHLPYFIPPSKDERCPANFHDIYHLIGLWNIVNKLKKALGLPHWISKEEMQDIIANMPEEEIALSARVISNECDYLIQLVPKTGFDGVADRIRFLRSNLDAFPGPRIIAQAFDELRTIRQAIENHPL